MATCSEVTTSLLNLPNCSDWGKLLQFFFTASHTLIKEFWNILGRPGPEGFSFSPMSRNGSNPFNMVLHSINDRKMQFPYQVARLSISWLIRCFLFRVQKAVLNYLTYCKGLEVLGISKSFSKLPWISLQRYNFGKQVSALGKNKSLKYNDLVETVYSES